MPCESALRLPGPAWRPDDMVNRTAITLLAATSVALSAVIGLAHGDTVAADAAAAAMATGLATYLSLPSPQKNPGVLTTTG